MKKYLLPESGNFYKANLHCHTTDSDGQDTPEQMIKAAIENGFKSIGFSGHSYTDFDEVSSMSLEGTEQYKKEIRELAERYKDKIEVFCGIEYDYYSDFDGRTANMAYVIKNCRPALEVALLILGMLTAVCALFLPLLFWALLFALLLWQLH